MQFITVFLGSFIAGSVLNQAQGADQQSHFHFPNAWDGSAADIHLLPDLD